MIRTKFFIVVIVTMMFVLACSRSEEEPAKAVALEAVEQGRFRVEVDRPGQLVVDGDLAYIVDESEIKVYNWISRSFVGSFRKKGQGPREAQGSSKEEIFVSIQIFSNEVLVYSPNKVLWFDKLPPFNYRGERRIPSTSTAQIVKIGKSYAAVMSIMMVLRLLEARSSKTLLWG